MSNVPFDNVVERLMSAMLRTRPNIYFLVVLIYHYQSNLGLVHYQAVKRILCYLCCIADFDQGADLKLRGCLDVEWGSDPNESSSTEDIYSPKVKKPCHGAVRSETVQHYQL